MHPPALKKNKTITENMFLKIKYHSPLAALLIDNNNLKIIVKKIRYRLSFAAKFSERKHNRSYAEVSLYLFYKLLKRITGAVWG